MPIEDNEVTELWALYKKARQEKRAHNRESGAAILSERGIKFSEHNGGAHLVVIHDDETIDFWPGTGRWQVRGDDRYQRGIKSLLAFLK